MRKEQVERSFKEKLSTLYYRSSFQIFHGLKSKTVYRIFGLKRTGNHAIINWMMTGKAGPSLLCNNLKKIQHPREGSKKISWQLGSPTLIASYEDSTLQEIEDYLLEDRYGPAKKIVNVLIVRDPFNLFASRYAWDSYLGDKFRNVLAYRNIVVRNWKNQAKTYLDWKNNRSPEEFVGINYNRWCVDTEYKQQLMQRLELTNKKIDSDSVIGFGGGSTFDGLSGDADQKDKFLKRFLKLKDNEDFRSIFKDQEVLGLSHKIFGHVEASEQLLDNSVI